MKIVLFGGAFDPPHVGHQQIVAHLLQKKIANQVWLIPTGKHQFAKNMTDSDLRIEMLEMLVESFPKKIKQKIKLEKCEIERQGVSQTYDTLKQLSKKYPQHDLSWIIGADNLGKFHLWDNYQQMTKEYKFYVYPRFNCLMKPLCAGMVPLDGVDQVKASSTTIRQRVKTGQSIDSLVTPEIRKFINQEYLYLA